MGRRLRGGALSIDGPSTAERRRSLAVANVLVRPIADIGSRCESPAVWAGAGGYAAKILAPLRTRRLWPHGGLCLRWSAFDLQRDVEP